MLAAGCDESVTTSEFTADPANFIEVGRLGPREVCFWHQADKLDDAR